MQGFYLANATGGGPVNLVLLGVTRDTRGFRSRSLD